jgi:hypothetical protein
MSELVGQRAPAAKPDSILVIDDAKTATRPVRLDGWAPGLGVTVIWLATLAAALFSPDLVTGSHQEHFPLIGAIDWLWAAVATGYVLMARPPSDLPGRTHSGAGSFLLSVTAVWATTAAASIFGPPLITGTDPTQIPLVALLVPLAAMAVTGFICLHALKRPAAQVSKRVRKG